MDLKPLLDELFSMTVIGIKPGLERIEALCASLDNPQSRYPVVHVAGTNGKGSTSAMLASILQAAGYKTGLYTSPHIQRFNERVRINGVMIPDEDLVRLARPLIDAAKPVEGSFFEVTTALAFQWFAEKRVDIAIIETGLGGRLDATNIVQPLVSVITSIDIDHTEYLGTTLESIAREKAGIIKGAAPCIIGETLAELRLVFDSVAQRLHTYNVWNDTVQEFLKDDLSLFAVPLFIAAMVLEVMWSRRRALGLYRGADTRASLSMGVLSILVEIVPRLVALAVMVELHAISPLRDVVQHQWWACSCST